MTAIPFLIALAVATLLFFVLANLRATKDMLAAGVLLRFYLYIASFVTLVVLVAGLTYLLTGLFSLGSRDFSYSRFVRPVPPPTAAVSNSDAQFDQQELEGQRDRQSTDLLRGGTLAVIGGLLFGVHAVLRRRGAPDESVEGNFRRGFLMVSLVTFGLVGLVALPVGVYQTLKFFLIAPLSTQQRVAPGNTLATGVVLTPLWIWYLIALTKQAQRPASEA
ncbi:MAG: hypothetical protein ACHQ7M_14310 [Chloroflexota bacterium]